MVDLRVVGGEGVLLDQVAGNPGQAVAFAVTVKVRSKDRPEASIGVGGSAAHPVLYAEVYHATREQAKQLKVGKCGRTSKDREHLHGCLYFRIGHQRQIDQTLDRVPAEGFPHRLVFGPDLLESRMCRQVNAEQTQASERAVDG